jgi:hypothetical protein
MSDGGHLEHPPPRRVGSRGYQWQNIDPTPKKLAFAAAVDHVILRVTLPPGAV